MLSSMAGVVITLLLLGYAFHLAEGDSPQVTPGVSTTCPAPDCAACLHQVCTCSCQCRSAHACSFPPFLARKDSAPRLNLPWLISFRPFSPHFDPTNLCFGGAGLTLPFASLFACSSAQHTSLFACSSSQYTSLFAFSSSQYTSLFAFEQFPTLPDGLPPVFACRKWPLQALS